MVSPSTVFRLGASASQIDCGTSSPAFGERVVSVRDIASGGVIVGVHHRVADAMVDLASPCGDGFGIARGSRRRRLASTHCRVGPVSCSNM